MSSGNNNNKDNNDTRKSKRIMQKDEKSNKQHKFPKNEDKRVDNFPRIIIPHILPTSSELRGFSREEERYLNNLKSNEREKLIKEVSDVTQTQKVPLRFRVLSSNLSNKTEIIQKLQHCDSSKYDSWVENALSIPINKYVKPPLCNPSNIEIGEYLGKTKSLMDKYIHGQYEAKDEMIRLLCQWVLTGNSKTFALGLEGPPGIGKTTFSKKILAQTMNRPFCFISLGGLSDASTLVGHSFTYEGAICGRITECIKQSKCMNPILYFDELDKVSKSPKGDEIISILIHQTNAQAA